MGDISADPALSGPWTAYRTWSSTSIYHQSEIDRLTQGSLWLGIAGAILATLGQQLAPRAPAEGTLLFFRHRRDQCLAFIQRCEDTMASENGAWVGLWRSEPLAKGES